MAIPLVLLHGYASSDAAFGTWKAALEAAGREVKDMHIGKYVTLNNEVTVDDIANGFQHAMAEEGLDNQPFDAIVHSTGMLVLRSWLTNPNAPPSRRGLLKHLVALAPATFGSPIAAKGRSLLGRIFIGNKTLGPDFLNSGNLVLSNLELGSEFTWDLAHRDLIDTKLYGPGNDTPYVFVFDGTDDYGKLAEIFDESGQEGTDGVVRWSGVALNTRKITLNLGVPSGGVKWSDWSNLIDIPMIPIAGVHHNKIMSVPPPELIQLVLKALNVNSEEEFDDFHKTDVANSAVVQAGQAKQENNHWQQFVVHAMDNHGSPITDYSIEVIAQSLDRKNETPIKDFEEDVHPYAADNSFRCFHVKLDGLADKIKGNRLIARIIANTGTELVGYQGYGCNDAKEPTPQVQVDLDLSDYDGTKLNQPSLFYPFTTTLIEIVLNRVPLPPFGIFQWESDES